MPDRVNLFGVEIDALTLGGAVDQIYDWIDRRDGVCRYVVTPNVDHLVTLRGHFTMRRAYDDASLVLADGAPVVWSSRLLRRRLPERVAGSDLVPALFEGAAARGEISAFLLGAAPGVAEVAARNVEARWPAVRVVGSYSPPLGFERDDEENEAILRRVNEASPDLLLLGLGAPKQELWIHRFHQRLDAPAALCVGATIDFLAGHRRRAPRWMQKSGMEWCHRVLSEPRRLFSRYVRDAVVFPQMVWNEWLTGPPQLPAG